MALSRGMVLFLFFLVVVAEIGTIDAKHAKNVLDPSAVEEEGRKEEEKEKEEDEMHCRSLSHQFHGFCFSSDTCAAICKKEGFPTGECKLEGGTRKCFCQKFC
ncbi:hypothetical protein U9M48_022695 [Paspalum notatum var. saurae]|uniref:Knottins-like domain-containing protein n=1 Tax=Paspalum notatum var. saurae TaxID=547442 RepID=A0AAQ3TKC4_PASNO